jgi:hypothetical protein
MASWIATIRDRQVGGKGGPRGWSSSGAGCCIAAQFAQWALSDWGDEGSLSPPTDVLRSAVGNGGRATHTSLSL